MFCISFEFTGKIWKWWCEFLSGFALNTHFPLHLDKLYLICRPGHHTTTLMVVTVLNDVVTHFIFTKEISVPIIWILALGHYAISINCAALLFMLHCLTFSVVSVIVPTLARGHLTILLWVVTWYSEIWQAGLVFTWRTALDVINAATSSTVGLCEDALVAVKYVLWNYDQSTVEMVPRAITVKCCVSYRGVDGQCEGVGCFWAMWISWHADWLPKKNWSMDLEWGLFCLRTVLKVINELSQAFFSALC